MCKFRNLKPDEVELRVAKSGKTRDGRAWAQYLIYKDARVDQRLLDETVGPMRWQKSYEFIDGKLYCTVSIWDDGLKQWVGKQDVGTESNTEKEKGQASDAFKRACFNWGVGRELYSAPDIFINFRDGEYTEKDGKVYPKAGLFSVCQLETDEDKRITRLTVTDKDLNVRFSFPKEERRPATDPIRKNAARPRPTYRQLAALARRIAAGEDLDHQIRENFTMLPEDWGKLEELKAESTNSINK